MWGTITQKYQVILFSKSAWPAIGDNFLKYMCIEELCSGLWVNPTDNQLKFESLTLELPTDNLTIC